MEYSKADSLVETEVKRLLEKGLDMREMNVIARHFSVLCEFPDSLNGVQFAACTLLSANSDGMVDPPMVSSFWDHTRLLMSMWFSGLLERRCLMSEAGPWYITQKARKMMEFTDLHND